MSLGEPEPACGLWQAVDHHPGGKAGVVRGQTPDYPPPFWRPEIRAEVLGARGRDKRLFVKTKREQGDLRVGGLVAMQPQRGVHVEGPTYVGVLQEDCSPVLGERSRWEVAVDRELVTSGERRAVVEVMWPKGAPDTVPGWYRAEELVELEYVWEHDMAGTMRVIT